MAILNPISIAKLPDHIIIWFKLISYNTNSVFSFPVIVIYITVNNIIIFNNDFINSIIAFKENNFLNPSTGFNLFNLGFTSPISLERDRN